MLNGSIPRVCLVMIHCGLYEPEKDALASFTFVPVLTLAYFTEKKTEERKRQSMM